MSDGLCSGGSTSHSTRILGCASVCSLQALFTPGTLLAGKYRVERVLGEGAMGVVLLARHIQLDEPVAIKIPRPESLGTSEAIARFLREARAAVKIKSEYVARVSDVGTLDTGEPFIVMEYLDGQDLAQRLKQRGPLPVEEAVEFVLQASEALAEAHALGIVHRDLKPANLFCVRRADGLSVVKVLDFGISKLGGPGAAGGATSMTRVGAFMGSPLYMSPEQIVSARDVDARSDLWALGVILFELVSARPPFSAETVIALGIQIIERAPASLRAIRPDLPPELERIILRCLEKDRARRYANAAELAQSLLEFAPKRARASVERIVRVAEAAGWSSPPPSSIEAPHSFEPPTPPLPTESTGTASSFGQTQLPSKSRVQPLIVGLSALTISAAAGAWFWFERHLPAPTESAQSAAPPPPLATPALTPLPTAQDAPSVLPLDAASESPPSPSALPTREFAKPAPRAPLKPRAPSKPLNATPRAAPVHMPPVSTQMPTLPLLSPPSPAAKNKPDCEPNYTLDAQGEKHFKSECF